MQRQQLQKQEYQQEPVGLLIAAARCRIKQAVASRIGRFGLSTQQFWVMVVISEWDGLSLRDLSRRLPVDQPTASRIVAALVRQRLLRVDDNPEDRRRSCLRLTARGNALGRDLRALAAKVRSAIV